MKTVSIIGCGSLGAIIAKGIAKGAAGNYSLKAVCDVNRDVAAVLAAQTGCVAAAGVGEVLAGKPDFVVEATSPAALTNIGEDILRAGCNLIPLSIGAFADGDFYNRIEQVANETGRKVYIVSGAIGGLDLMQAMLLMGDLSAAIENTKAPHSLNGAPFLGGRELSEAAEETVFSGNAREAIQGFPKNVNVAVALSLATVGVDDTRVTVRSVPGLEVNRHRITLTGSQCRAEITVESLPSPENPRSSSLAAYSVLARLRNMEAGIAMM